MPLAALEAAAPIELGTTSDEATIAPRATLTPLLMALAVMFVWGGTPMLSKIAVGEVDPLLVGVLRTVIAGVIALPLALAMRQPLPSGTRPRQLLAVSGFAAFVAFPLLFTVGQSMTSAMHGALILATLPVFTSLFGTLIERRKISATWSIGCALALAGEVVVITWRGPSTAVGSSVAGDVIVLGSSAICALGYVAGARLTQRGYASLPTTLWGVTVSSIVLLPLLGWMLIRGGFPEAGVSAWGSILILAVLTSVLGYVVWYRALALGGISRIASIQFTQPLFGMGLAALFLGERPAPITGVAAVAILIGASLVLRAGSR